MFAVIVALIVVLLAAAVIAAHDYFSGRSFILHVIDELRLASTGIAVLDRRCQANPDRSDVIVCLSTLPSRLPMIDDALKSLMRQTRAPAEIRIYLPAFSKRENRPYAVPTHLRRLKSVTLVENVEDHGPATKFRCAIGTAAPDQKLLIVDDDRIFPPDMLALLDAAATADPSAAFCVGGWIVPADLTDRPTTMMMNINRVPPAQIRPSRMRQPTPIDIVMGAHGFIIRPRHVDLVRLFDDSAGPPSAFFADDIWISGYCHAPKYAVPIRRADFQPYRHIPRYDRSSLGWVNRTGNPETWANTAVLRWFGADPWLVGGAAEWRLPASWPAPADTPCEG